ncbi:MAG: hypothetical protein QG579_3 [Patescibacteria group bacterium]|nr:hypothetical protein [Patescibacteria group bacterium]MDQ5968846.1 hypothetical protein [Patescibacteria group bacterium]
MRNKLTIMFLTAFLVVLTACSSTKQVSDNKKMSPIVDDAKTQKVNELRSRFETLTTNKSMIANAAMLGDTVDGPCTLYYEWQSLNTVKAAYDKLEYGLTDFSANLNEAVKTAAQKATTAAYERMKNGKTLSCKGLTNDRLTLFGNIAKLMDEYGRPADTEAFDPAILRAACLREIKPEVQEILATIKKYDANSDTLGWLANYVESVKTTWHFTPEEIGVPKALITRLDL